jgi:hypothetical protein
MSNKETAGPTSPAFLFLDESPVPIPQPSETLSFRPQQTTAKAVVCEVEEPAVKCLRRFSCVNVPTQAKIGLEWHRPSLIASSPTPPSNTLPQKKGALSAKPEYNSRRLRVRFRDHDADHFWQGDNYRSAAVCRKLYSSKPDQSWVV